MAVAADAPGATSATASLYLDLLKLAPVDWTGVYWRRAG